MISVLYVDDEPDLLVLAKLFLEESGEFMVGTSTSAHHVLDTASIPSYDAIVSDYQMPEMDGIAFLKMVRERFGNVPFILFTGRGREEVVIEALNNGADFYLQKGGEPTAQFAELANKIQYAVARKRAETELQRKNDELNASYEQIAANEEELRQQLEELTEKQDALRSSEEKFRAFTENIPDLTTIVDMTGVYTYISPSIQRITGQSVAELLGKPFGGIDSLFGLLPEDKELLLKSGRIAIEKPGEAITVLPFRIRDVANEAHFIEGTMTFLPGVKGIQGILFHGRDITDRIRAEEELRKKNEELHASYEQITAAEEELRGQYDELAHGDTRIRESEEKFRGIFEKIHDALVLFTKDGCIDCNQQALELYGFPTKEEMFGLLPIDLSPQYQPDGQESRGAADAHTRTVFLNGIDRFEWLHQRKDGSTFLADILLSAFEIDGKQAFLSSARDITERKQMEDQLRFLKISVDRSSDEVFWMDLNASIIYVNDAACQTTGYSRDELLSMNLSDMAPGFSPAGWEALFTELRQKKTASITTRHRCKNGTLVDVEIVCVYVNKDNREYSFAFVRDITGRKLAERELQESEENYRHILDNMQDAYIRTDTHGNVAMANPAAARMYGYTSADEMIGILADSLYINPEQRTDVLEKLRETGRIADSTGTGRKKDGTPFWVSINLQNILDDAGSSKGTEAIVRDITERKIMEQAIQEANRKLNLLSSITRHDVANQLTMLQGYVQLAALKNADPGVADFLSKIGQSADAITHQIAFTKTYQELGVHLPGWFQLDVVITGGCRKEIRLSRACMNTEIFSDPMIERVFFNLCDNAQQHGGHVTEIVVRCEQASEDLVIIVEDNGVGIAPEFKEKIFEKGYGKNTGFGLFLAREILAITGITIRETGLFGAGARFEITVPKDAFRNATGNQDTG